AIFHRDIANITMTMNNIEHLVVNAKGGPDTIDIGDMTGTDFKSTDVDLSGAVAGSGDGAQDVVSVAGSGRAHSGNVTADGSVVDVGGLKVGPRITGAEPTDELHINTGDGHDSVNVASPVLSLITPSVDLGAGQ